MSIDTLKKKHFIIYLAGNLNSSKKDRFMENGNGNLKIERVFNAPIEAVWKAWTEPKDFMKWWGPEGFTCPYSQIDLVPGGKYLCCTRTPTGQDFWTTGIYIEIEKNKKIKYTVSFADSDGKIVSPEYYYMGTEFPKEMIVTIHFEVIEGKTNFTLIQDGVPEGNHSEQTKIGWNQSFDKLDSVISNN